VRVLQREIIRDLCTVPVIDAGTEVRRTIDFMKDYLLAHPFLRGFVLGISGGQDSTLLGKLAQMAVDELNVDFGGFEFVALRLPYGVQFDECDCQDALAFIKPSDSFVVDIKPAVDASVVAVERAMSVKSSHFHRGNVKARHRMEVQYHVGALRGLAVLGTDHSAEAVTGFFTKFGDGGADLTPLFRLNKSQGRKMLQFLNCPIHLYEKVPTADLEDDRPGLADEVALGVTYAEIDRYLEGIDVGIVASEKIEDWYLKSRHKRHLPVTIFDDWWKK